MAALEKLSITLPAEMVDQIKARIDEGAYGSTSEVIREALRLWREREEERRERLEAIRARLEKSAQSGPDIPLDEAFDHVEGRLRARFKNAG